MKSNIFKIKFIALAIVSIISLVACKESSPVEVDTDHFEANGILVKFKGADYLKILNGALDPLLAQQFSLIVGDTSGVYTVTFLDSLGKDMGVPLESDHVFGWEIADTSVVKLRRVTPAGWDFKLIPGKPLSTEIELRILHIDHPDFKTPKITVNVK